MNVTRSMSQADVRGKRVLVRVDFNVPLDAEGHITDDTRIRVALPTIEYLIDHDARIILTSHLGRPKGQVVPSYSLRPVAQRLSELLQRPVRLAPDCVGPQVAHLVAGMRPGDIVLLENLRFHPEEEENDEQFARKLAALADVYIDDAFGAAHRAHASTAAVAHLLPSYAGFLMERELDALGRILTAPDHPFVVVTGGAKISGKIDILQHLLPAADCFLVGGGMANTLLMARGHRIGASLVEPEKLSVARSFLKAAEEAGKAVYLPVDVVIATELRPHSPTMTVPIRQIPNQWRIVDIGPRTIEQFRSVLQGAHTALWNGPMGVFEIEQFARGTEAIARILALSGASTIVAGGDTVAAVERTGLARHMTHVSSGGGACLEYLEGRTLPGVAALQSG